MNHTISSQSVFECHACRAATNIQSQLDARGLALADASRGPEVSRFARLVAEELKLARVQHGKISGAHDGYGRILEEVDEFWEQVKRRASMRDRENMCRELIQIAAMAQRTAEDLDLLP